MTTGGAFTFKSVFLYSSTTVIPYVFDGYWSGTRVYSVSQTRSNTFGAYVEVENPEASRVIDTLIIRVSNPAPPGRTNPVGIDTLTVMR